MEKPPVQDRFLGREILGGQFKILKKIGTGGMGSVYMAAQPAMGRHVAIKILHPKLAARKDLTSRFRREARAMSQLTHPNTVKVFMYGQLENDGSLYIVMEYLEGRNLNRAVKKQGRMPVEQAVPILVQVCGALQEAHDKGIIHRDLKPENIFLAKQGELTDYPKVLDFGLAKVTENEMRPGSVQLTQEGMVFGTPEFMSPEQAQGKTLDARSDIYSLAIILYEALTGKLPFEARTAMEFIQKHVVETPIPLNQRVPGLVFPEGLEHALNVALAKKPEQRYQTAIEFAGVLKPYAGSQAGALDAIFQMTPQPPSSSLHSQGNFVPGPPSSSSSPVHPPVPALGTLSLTSAPANPPRGASLLVLVLVAIVFLTVGVLAALYLPAMFDSIKPSP